MKKIAVLLLLGTLLPLALNGAVRPEGIRHLTEDDGLSSNYTRCCLQDSRGFIWIGTGAGLDRYDGEQIRSFTHPTRCLTQTGNLIWAGTEDGIYTYSLADGHFSPFTAVTSYGVNIISRVNDIVTTNGHIIWAGTEGQGLFRYDILSGTLTQHSVHTPFVEEIIPAADGMTVAIARDGSAHIYSARGDYLRPVSTSFPPKDHTITDREGTKWIPTAGSGVEIVPEAVNGPDFHPLPTGAESAVIQLADDQEGNIIAGVKDRLYIFSPASEPKFRLLANISPHGQITQLLCAPEGIWIGTDTDCICRYVPGTGKTVHYHTGGKTNVLYRTRRGVIMAGTPLGVFSWDPDADKLRRDLNRSDIVILIDGRKPVSPSLPKEFEVVSQSSVVAMCEDADAHYLYLATSNRGLFRKDLITNGWEHLLTSGGGLGTIPWNRVTSLQRTEDGTIWADTDGEGQWMMMPATLSFVQASRQDGITLRHGQKAESILYASDGRTYIGSRDGISIVQPQSESQFSKWPLTAITEISVGDSTLYVPPGGRSITLSYPQSSLTVTMAALSYTDPAQNRFSWQLEGIDKDWTVPRRIQTASYQKLNPGEYVFRVQGSDDILKISVRPPWWRSGWAMALYIVLTLVGVAFLLLIWQRAIRLRYNEMMQRQEEEREKALYRQRIRFFLGLIHEIRTPLTLIRLQHEKEAPGRNDSITRNLDYMQDTIDRILTYDKNSSGTIEMLKTRLDLRDVVRSVTETFREGADAEGIMLDTQIDTAPIMVNADEDMVTKILTNLLSNALKYTKDRIYVAISSEESCAVIRVCDNGKGVRKDQRDKIFGMFYTPPDDKVAEASGIGVGLAYARQLAEAHGGSLEVEEAVPSGASFVLRLPLLQEVQADAALQQESGRDAAEKLAVIVVEDNRELRETLRSELGQWYDVICAADGVEALGIIEDKDVDVVVSDVMMPVMDGLELCRRIKGQLAYSHIPVILLTAKVTLDAKSEGMESGADAYVEKPFTMRQLKGQIDNLIRLREAFRRSMSGTAEGAAPSGPEADFMHSINESIEKQLSEESFSIEGLASDMAMSRTNFFRKFKALTGVTPGDYLKNYRLDRAAELIRSGARINEAAESVGFTSSSYFAKCFKARFGVLPKAFARNL